MKTRKYIFMAIMSGIPLVTMVKAQSNVITYQGHLTESGLHANGLFDFSFELFTDPVAGSSWGAATNTAVLVSNGLFTTQIDVGAGVFDGTALWLQIGATTNGGGSYSILTPRQRITQTPYAIYAESALASVNADQLNGYTDADFALSAHNHSGTYADLSHDHDSSYAFLSHNHSGTYSLLSHNHSGIYALLSHSHTIGTGDLDSTVLNETFWRLDGNSGTIPGSHYIGTADNQPLELRVNNTRALRIEYPTIGSVPNLIGGSFSSSIAGGTYGAIVAAGYNNDIDTDSNYSTVGGGDNNTIGSGSGYATISGGSFSDIGANADYSVVGGGYNNNIADNAGYAAIPGGYLNDIGADSDFSTVGGGRDNNIGDSSQYATISSGYANDIGFNSDYSTVGGGYNNNIAGNSFRTTISGGYANDIGVNDHNSTLGGGYNNNIGDNSSASTLSGGYNNNIASNSVSGTIAGGYFNDIGVDSDYGTLGGGYDNNIASNSFYATIGGGYLNDIGVDSDYSVVGGGRDNNIASGSWYGTIAGGYGNDIGDYSDQSAVGGGLDNDIASGSLRATISGGYFNKIGINADYSTVGGGYNNNIASNAYSATVAGGYLNDIGVNADYGIVAGGYNSDVGDGAYYAYAAGYRAKANHIGAFVWADTSSADFASLADNEFAVRTAGGMRVIGSTTNSTLTVAPNNTVNGDVSQVVLGEDYQGSLGMLLRYDGNQNQLQVYGKSGATEYGPHLVIPRSSSYVGIGISPGYPLHMASGARCTVGGVWTDASSRTLKENFTKVDGGEILAKLLQLEVTQWNYKNENEAILHIGPVAEDFYATFGLGGRDDGISSSDRGGIALVAIQELARENAILQQRNDELEQRLCRLERILETQVTGDGR